MAAQNLFTITGYSGMGPEVGYGGYQNWVSGIDLGFYPSPRTYMVGDNNLNLKRSSMKNMDIFDSSPFLYGL